MKKLAILGLGHIGKYVYETLQYNKKFPEVNGYDLTNGYDLNDDFILEEIIKKHDGVLASTPFFLNKKIAEICAKYNKDYFDLTESVEVTDYVKELSKKQDCRSRFVTQCGLAPGMVSIIANYLASKFSQVESIEIRVGALPINPTNSLSYYRTWNTEGLVNEYINPCPALINNKLIDLEPVADVRKIVFDGLKLESANTSGGIGSLPHSYINRAKNVVYQTLRYPGHWSKIKFLKEELGLKSNFETYVKLFNENIPMTNQDVVYILIDVMGYDDQGQKNIRQYHKKIKHNDDATAIQLSTAGGVMAVLDSWIKGDLDHFVGWVRQEHLDFYSVWTSSYADVYK